MNYAEQQKNPLRNTIGFFLVVLFHIGLIWVIASGLGTNIIQKVMQPLETKIVEAEKKKLDDAPPPPPPAALQPPPPPYIPPPEVNIQQTATVSTNAITQVTHTAPVARAAVVDQGPSSNPAVGSSRPQFPEELQESGATGRVTVRCDIEADGHPTGCVLMDVSGGSAFGTSVMRWLQSGRALYKPAIRNGQAVRFPGKQLTIDFNLTNDE
jgi:protein TonB